MRRVKSPEALKAWRLEMDKRKSQGSLTLRELQERRRDKSLTYEQSMKYALRGWDANQNENTR